MTQSAIERFLEQVESRNEVLKEAAESSEAISRTEVWRYRFFDEKTYMITDDSGQTWNLTGAEVTRKTFFGATPGRSESVRYIGHKLLASGRTSKKEETLHLGQDALKYFG
jgi:hypothetical protein